MRHARRYVRNPGGGPRGGISAGTLLLLGGAAFVLLTPTGRGLIGSLGLGTGPTGSIPSSLPVGTVRLPNGQYRLPNGQVVGAPASGQAPVAGSSITPIIGAAVQSLPSIVSLFRDLFSSTAGGTGAGGATGSPGAGGSVSVPAVGESVVPVEIPIGTLTLGDGSVLEIGGAVPWELAPYTLGADLTLEDPTAGIDWWASGSEDGVPMELTNVWGAEWDPSAFSFDPDVSWVVDPSLDFGFGALPVQARVGYVPPPMRHG